MRAIVCGTVARLVTLSPRGRHAVKLESAAPVFQVGDIASTMAWYAATLGFKCDPFPDAPPYVFCILTKDAVEIMLQKIEDPSAPPRMRGAWNAYFRMEGVEAFYEDVRKQPNVVMREPLHRQPYGDTEFVI